MDTVGLAKQVSAKWLADEAGQPLKLYHGTRKKFDAFAPNLSGKRLRHEHGDFGRGHYLTPDKQLATEYSRDSDNDADGHVMGPLHAAIKRPFIWDASSDEAWTDTAKRLGDLGIKRKGGANAGDRRLRSPDEADGFTRAAIAAGHDGVVYVRPKFDDLDKGQQYPKGEVSEVVAFHSNQIKHADTPEPNMDDPNIYRKDGGRTARADGGSVTHTGPIHSHVAGRTDHLPMHVKAGSYVIPADIISAMGEGNSMAGFKVARDIFSAKAPYGQKGMPYAASGLPYGVSTPGKAAGGATDGVPIVAAGGEYVISPEDVIGLGGSLDDGHKVLDHFVKKMRKNTIKTLKSLPGPAKN